METITVQTLLWVLDSNSNLDFKTQKKTARKSLFGQFFFIQDSLYPFFEWEKEFILTTDANLLPKALVSSNRCL